MTRKKCIQPLIYAVKDYNYSVSVGSTSAKRTILIVHHKTKEANHFEIIFFPDKSQG